MSDVTIKAVVFVAVAAIGAGLAIYTYFTNNEIKERNHRVRNSTGNTRNYTWQSPPGVEEDTFSLKCKHCKTLIGNEEPKGLKCKSIFHADCIDKMENIKKHVAECGICRTEYPQYFRA